MPAVSEMAATPSETTIGNVVDMRSGTQLFLPDYNLQSVGARSHRATLTFLFVVSDHQQQHAAAPTRMGTAAVLCWLHA